MSRERFSLAQFTLYSGFSVYARVPFIARHVSHEAGDGDDAQPSGSGLTQWPQPSTELHDRSQVDVLPAQFTGSWPAFGFSDVAMQRSPGRLGHSQTSLPRWTSRLALAYNEQIGTSQQTLSWYRALVARGHFRHLRACQKHLASWAYSAVPQSEG